MTTKYSVEPGDTLWAIAERFYGDGRRHRVIAVANGLADPDHIVVGQELEVPFVTFRHRVRPADTKQALAQRFYGDVAMSEVFEIASGAAQRDLIVGEWLLVPGLDDPGHHTVADGETLPQLAQTWYGEAGLWPIIAVANQLGGSDPATGTVLIQPRMNRRRTVAAGDTLWELANDEYGDYGDDRTALAVRLVAAANLIDDQDHIAVSQVLHFPSMWP
jgi:nucleoid-associated protein YgaU